MPPIPHEFPTPHEPAASPDESTRSVSRLSADSPTPLHVQLADAMRAKISTLEWRRGGYIPSEADLMAEFGVSRGTVRRAIGTLASEGLLVSRKGSGTMVASGGIVRPDGARSFSFAASLRESGVRYVTRVLQKEVLEAPESVAAALHVDAGSPVLFMRRVRSVSDHPVVCQESWSNLRVCPGLDEADFEQESLFDAVERCSGGRIALSHMHYLPRLAGEEHGGYLGCSPSEPVIVLEQTIELEGATPIEWSHTWIGPNQSIVGVSRQADGLPGPLDLEGFAAPAARTSRLAVTASSPS